MNKHVPIASIHGVNVYGKLPKRHIKTLKKIEQITTEREWYGIQGIYCIDSIVNHGVMGSYFKAYCPLQPMVPVTLTYKNGESDRFDLTLSKEGAIVLTSQESECSFAFIALHELAHHIHNDLSDDRKSTSEREKEISAHLFALRRIEKLNTTFNNKLNALYLKEAIKIYNREKETSACFNTKQKYIEVKKHWESVKEKIKTNYEKLLPTIEIGDIPCFYINNIPKENNKPAFAERRLAWKGNLHKAY